MSGERRTTVLITGANRGIGLGLVSTYLSRPSTAVIAAVRDPSHPSSQTLTSLPKGPSSTLAIVKIDSKSPTDAANAVTHLKSQGINSLDLVIANAGICNDLSTLATADPEVVKEHVDVNGFGVLYLFQATLPLLLESGVGGGAKFVGIGSPLGSIGGMDQRPYPATAYGTSKAVQHWIVRKIHYEHPELVALVVDPGFVQTDLGNAGARALGMEKAFIETKDSVAGVVAQIDAATKEKGSGSFTVWTGETFPW